MHMVLKVGDTSAVTTAMFTVNYPAKQSNGIYSQVNGDKRADALKLSKGIDIIRDFHINESEKITI